MFDFSELPDAPIEGLQEAYDDWTEPREFPPPVLPGTDLGVICKLHPPKVTGADVYFQFDLQLRGGENDGRLITFAGISTKTYQRKSGGTGSQVADFLRPQNFPVPRSAKEFGEILNSFLETKVLRFRHGVQATCQDCYKAKMEETGDKKEANKFALKASKYNQLPTNGNGEKLDTFKCDVCGAEVRARANVTAWLPIVKEAD